jgi:YD repeat-containing protein
MKTKYLFTALSITSLFTLTSATRAEVNLKNASFLSHWLDLALPGPQGALELRRFYNSRSARIGLFGFGWCSAYEKSLTIINNSVTLSDCAVAGTKSPSTVARGPAGYDIKSENEDLRFDKAGHLVQIKSPEGPAITLTYTADNRLTEIKTVDGRKLQLIYDAKKERVIEIRASDGRKVKYQYVGDDLSAVIEKNTQARFIYNKLHNLTRIEHATGEREIIGYDDAVDRVVKYQAANGCTDLFKYESAPSDIFTVSGERHCGAQVVQRAAFHFTGDREKNNFQSLTRELSSEGK